MRAEYPNEALREYDAPLAEKLLSASGCVFTGYKIMGASGSFGIFSRNPAEWGETKSKIC